MATFTYKAMTPSTGADTLTMLSAWLGGISSNNRLSDTFLIAKPAAGLRSALFGDHLVWTTSAGPLRPLSGGIERLVFTYLHVDVLTITDWRLSGLAFGNAELTGFNALTDLILSGADRVFGTPLGDTIRSGAGADRVQLYGGNDTLFGGDGADTAFGHSGNDILWGESGRDLLYGGGGDDTLGGSFGRDRLFGQSGSDVLLGEGSADLLDGGSGDDTLIGGQEDDRLLGGTGDDYLSADDGSDALIGGAGADTLIGGADADRFVLDQTPGGANIDVIGGFEVDLDLILLSRHAFQNLGPLGTLTPSRFRLGPNATDASDRILYDTAAGALWYDQDGTGPMAKVKIADMSSGLGLDAADFRVID